MNPAEKTSTGRKPKAATQGEEAIGPEAVIELTPEWQAEYLADMRIERARIPRRFLGKTFETFKTGRNADLKAMVQHAKAWVEGFYLDLDDPKEEGNTHKGFLIEGVVGCGKTHIAVAILQAVIRKGFSGLFYNMPDLLSDIRATYSNESSVSESGLLEEINRPDLLVLDDLGAEATKDWINDRLYLIVNRRYDSCKPVIVTTNLTVDDLSEKLGERTVSRLLEMCLPFTPFPKRDYRREILHGDFEPWKTTDRKKTR